MFWHSFVVPKFQDPSLNNFKILTFEILWIKPFEYKSHDEL
jgi:hypothetical protein